MSQFGFHLRRRCAGRRTSGLGRPATELAPDERTDRQSILPTVLEAEVDVAFAALDPFLDNQVPCFSQDHLTRGHGFLPRPHSLCTGCLIAEVELLVAGFYHRRKL